MSKFSEAEKLWQQQSEASAQRDYSFDTVSGEKVNTLYYPDANDDYIEKLNKQRLGGFSDWRLPSKLEIQSLYEIARPFQSRGKTFILHIDPVFEFSYGSCFWTNRTRLSAALGFEFDVGDTHWYPQGSLSGTVRAVRLDSDSLILIEINWTNRASDKYLNQ